ncbi:hypothetical protein HYH02_006397 [Chlamydomonas schloesseri]|uniref:Uncharacterized protein n=1 Tax=Chlamydomonas schloesseri TaxID=2026947 RepID=A0A836B5T7_9CHLO|nr:hypothetical protein HYH02_006397 [Chlamydomonas schloesseri]|eukprot:KAG2448506.1 hypothetical protein HYH02_006397 [Chlamydomonas schloesseri]
MTESRAEFQDFAPIAKKHVGGPQDQLGPGLQPLDEAKLPVTLARSRVVHDGADLIDDPDSFVATATKQAVASAGPMMSSYQAMQAGMPLEPKKRTGKKCVAPQDVPGAGRGGLFFGSASAASTRVDPGTVLEMGTTKQSAHIPGYCGHIPKTAATTDPAPQRTHDKSLVVENYKPYGTGYTGRKAF